MTLYYKSNLNSELKIKIPSNINKNPKTKNTAATKPDMTVSAKNINAWKNGWDRSRALKIFPFSSSLLIGFRPETFRVHMLRCHFRRKSDLKLWHTDATRATQGFWRHTGRMTHQPWSGDLARGSIHPREVMRSTRGVGWVGAVAPTLQKTKPICTESWYNSLHRTSPWVTPAPA